MIRHAIANIIQEFSTLTGSSKASRLFLKSIIGLTLILLGVLTLTAGAGQAQAPASAERIAFAAYKNGQWDIYSLSLDGSELRQLTNDSYEDTDPAYSTDGTKLAYASRRNNNWDVYVLDLTKGELLRVTDSPHYDGRPAWHPNANLLVYESYQAGNLDIWQVVADGSEPATNLTVDSSAGDFAPAWSPDGETIAFTSWRAGNKDLYLLNSGSRSTVRVTNSPAAEEGATWHPDGDRLAFVLDDFGDRELFSLDLTTLPVEDGPVQQLTWLGRTDSPHWSPDGSRIAAVFHRWDGEVLVLETPGARHQLPLELTAVVTIHGRLSWNRQAVEFGERVSTLFDGARSPLYDEGLVPNDSPEAERYSLVRQNDLTVGTPWLADTVDDSFQTWRSHLRDESGYDFLSELSDAARDIGSYTETSQYASWHKSGRAVDTLFDYYVDGQLFHEITREDYSGETYWRTWLRCSDQSGRCGRPLTAAPWNYSRLARTDLAPEQGGAEKPISAGYYVDLTAIAREYGWDRISSYDDVDYSWTWHFLAFEYWHFQKRLEREPGTGIGNVNWYQAMRQVYPQASLDRFFTWDKMRERGEDPYLIALKGVPLPLEHQPWWVLVEQ
jgi:TolB protein